jgi:hypothetical protein
MKIGVLLTGAVRTLRNCISYMNFYNSSNNQKKETEYHIFATLECEEHKKKEIEHILQEHFKSSFKSLYFFDKNTKEYNDWKEEQKILLHKMNVNQNIKEYLFNSGSMLEYKQLELCFSQLENYEKNQSVKYDYVIRIRPDLVLTHPLDFHWLNLSDEDIQRRLEKIRDIFKKSSNIPNGKLLTFFMSTLYSEKLIDNILGNEKIMYEPGEFPQEAQYINKKDPCIVRFLELENQKEDKADLETKKDEEIQILKILKEYIKNGNYIVTIRKNLCYIVKREYISSIANLSKIYGSINFFNNDYFWNAESQFRSICALSGLSIYNYSTNIEEKSLYEYDRNNYLNDKGESHNHIFYFLMRN